MNEFSVGCHVMSMCMCYDFASKAQKALYEMEIAMFCYPQQITHCHVKKLSRMICCDWLKIAK